ncbi:MAG: DUF3298 domain-containing protein [Chloroflexi bacterium]|nr:DUF3298 domain-containing protein [Chloroflexota bacterium]MBU1746621.1 DUF3298 domain-containing protein [Chloroflexota bacterium]
MKNKPVPLFVGLAFALLSLGLLLYAQGVLAMPALTGHLAATPDPNAIDAQGIDLGQGLTLVSDTLKIDIDAPYLVGDDTAVKFNQALDTLVNQEVDRFRKEAQAMGPVRGIPTTGGQGQLIITHTVTAAAHDVVSVFFQEFDNVYPMAHPSYDLAALNYDVKADKTLALADLFKADTKYLDVIAAYCVQDLEKRQIYTPDGGPYGYDKGVEATPENYRHWNIAEPGLWITFDMYQVAGRGQGMPRVVVPYDALQDIINPDGPLAPFAGGEAGGAIGATLKLEPAKTTVHTRAPHIYANDAAAEARVEPFNQAAMLIVTQEISGFQFIPTAAISMAASNSLIIDYDAPASTPDLVSILFRIESYTAGAAHPAHHSAVLNYDLKAGKVLALADLFKPDTKYLDAIANYCIDDLGKRGILDFKEGAEAKAENYRSWNVTPQGLQITFDPAQVAAYAAGPQTVAIPYTALEDVIDPAGPLAPFLTPATPVPTRTQPPTPRPTSTPTPTPTPTPKPTPEPVPPVVQIQSPGNGHQYTVGQTVQVEFIASDESGVTHVALFVGGSQVVDRPYSPPPTSKTDTLAWMPTSTGQYTLNVIAYDPHGNNNWGEPAQVIIQVNPDVTPPTVMLNSPTQPAVIPQGQPLQFLSTIHDEGDITLLELWQNKNGQQTRLEFDPGRHSTQPGGYQWTVQHAWTDAGPRTIFIKAQDARGLWGQSAGVTINVIDAPPVVDPPVYGPNPVNQGQVFNVVVHATDGNGIKQFHLHVGDQVVAQSGVLGKSPRDHTWQVQWTVPANQPTGPFPIWVRVTDVADQYTETPQQTITIQGGGPPPPTQVPQPTPIPDHASIVANWSAQVPGTGQTFVLNITDKHASGRLKGTLTIQPGQQTGDFNNDSNIDQRQGSINVQIGPVTYVFQFTMTEDRLHLEGQWSTSAGGAPQPITFDRMLQ